MGGWGWGIMKKEGKCLVCTCSLVLRVYVVVVCPNAYQTYTGELWLTGASWLARNPRFGSSPFCALTCLGSCADINQTLLWLLVGAVSLLASLDPPPGGGAVGSVDVAYGKRTTIFPLQVRRESSLS